MIKPNSFFVNESLNASHVNKLKEIFEENPPLVVPFSESSFHPKNLKKRKRDDFISEQIGNSGEWGNDQFDAVNGSLVTQSTVPKNIKVIGEKESKRRRV